MNIVYTQQLLELAVRGSFEEHSSGQKTEVFKFVEENFPSIVQEVRSLAPNDRSWVLLHIAHCDKEGQNAKMNELARILREAPEQSGLTDEVAPARATFVEALDLWVADPSTTGQKEVARQRILAAYDSKSEGLNLFNLGLNTVPSVLGELVDLRVLTLSVNELSSLPPIGKLAKLRELKLDRNKFSELPFECRDLRKLEKLELDYNQITSLPNEIGLLDELYSLNVSDNKLQGLPKGIGNLKKLESLYIRNNELTELPSEIGGLGELTILYAGNNHFETLPPEIGTLENLQYLGIENNPELTELPPTLVNHPIISKLCVEGTKLPGKRGGSLGSIVYDSNAGV